MVHPDAAREPCDVVFLALPTQAAAAAARGELETGARVIDLGSAFRLRDREIWERLYGGEHPDWPLAEEAVYGISELHEAEIRAARLVANPGCFSTATILALAPLLDEAGGDLDPVVVTGLSGTAGAGAELSRAAHHPEIGANLVAYNAVDHRHSYEMEQELGALAGRRVAIHFTPVYVPIVRGILAVCSVQFERTPDRTALLDRYRGYYAETPFVHVWDRPAGDGEWRYEPYPWTSAVAGTNHCLIGLDVDPRRGRVVVLAALDSIGKGGASAGVENMNLLLGWPRDAGLSRRGLHP
jgi:N-acetyl-gamma-glutamyl-phosphate reductase